jgi:hypothetical protein
MSAEHGIWVLNLQILQTGTKPEAALPPAPPPPLLLLPMPRLPLALAPPEPPPPDVPDGLTFGER